jgi:hypothetical protein
MALTLRETDLLQSHWARIDASQGMFLQTAMAAYLRVVLASDSLRLRVETLNRIDGVEALFATATATRSEERQFPAFNSWEEEAAFSHALYKAAAELPAGRGWSKLSTLVTDRVEAEPYQGKMGRQTRALIDTFVRPFHMWMTAEMSLESDVVAAVWRFERWAEWFGRAKLESVLRKEVERVVANTKRKREFEKELQQQLFEWLFKQGFPLSAREPASSAGRADFVLFGVDDKYIPIEAKVLSDPSDGTGFSLGQLPEAKQQITAYLAEYGAEFGILVLFDRTAHGVIVAGHDLGVPPSFKWAGRRVHCFVVQCIDRGSATEQKKASARTVVTSQHFEESAVRGPPALVGT